MIYDKPHAPREIRMLQRWCNNYTIFKTTPDFYKYDPKRGGENVSACRNCGAEIDWMRTEEGRYIPMDPDPVFVIEGEGAGTEHFYTEEEGVLIGRRARPEEVQTREAKINTPLGFVPHWRTCRARR